MKKTSQKNKTHKKSKINQKSKSKTNKKSKTNEIKLDLIKKSDFDNVLELTTNLDIMQYIGNSKIWDKEKVSKFINYCINDEKVKDNKREQYYYKIINSSDDFIGIIGFHKFVRKELPQTNNDFFLTIYLNPKQQNKGYFSESMKLLIKKMNKVQPRKDKLYSLVRQSNEKMNLISKTKYTFIKKIKLINELLNLYSIKI
jgi:RimJ/RimL family protein N-acetyltransferase